jgi:NADH dehydrogenase
VIGIDEDGVTIQAQSGTEHIAAKTVIWAAGVTATSFGKVLEQRCGARLDRSGRVQVQPDLTVPGHPEIFVIGDLATLQQDGEPLPGVAPVAMQEGHYVAKVIQARLSGREMKPFHYFDKGILAVIGRAAAVADFGKVQLHGLIAWLVWLFVHLMYIVEFENRVLVFIQWGFQYLTYNRGARLITGERTLPKKGEMRENEPAAQVR